MADGPWRPGMGDPLRPPGFDPRPVRAGDYMDMHPTRYLWDDHIEPLIRKIYRLMGGPDEIHINSYYDHPPDDRFPRRWPVDFYSRLSFDVWGPAGRNDPISKVKGDRVIEIVWNDSGRPYIDWCIWQRRMYWRKTGFAPTAYGTSVFSWHEDHPHFTFMPQAWLPD